MSAPGQSVPPASRASELVAVDVGGTSIKVEVLGSGTDHLQRVVTPTPRSRRGNGAAVDVVGTVAAIIGDLGLDEQPVGLVVPGIVDENNGVARYSATFGWSDAPMAQMLSDRTGGPVALAHDVAAGGTAERELGAARGGDDVAVVVIGTGIAAALWVQGRRITTNPVGEIGHVAYAGTSDTAQCGCGRTGCLEAVASAAAIARRYNELSGHPDAALNATHVADRLDIDNVARDVWNAATRSIAGALLSLTALVGTKKMVLTGGLANAGDLLFDPIRTWCREMATVEPLPEVVPGAFTDRSVIVGAGVLARGLQ